MAGSVGLGGRGKDEMKAKGTSLLSTRSQITGTSSTFKYCLKAEYSFDCFCLIFHQQITCKASKAGVGNLSHHHPWLHIVGGIEASSRQGQSQKGMAMGIPMCSLTTLLLQTPPSSSLTPNCRVGQIELSYTEILKLVQRQCKIGPRATVCPSLL